MTAIQLQLLFKKKLVLLPDFSTKHEALYAELDGLHDLLQPDEEPDEEPEEEPVQTPEAIEEPAQKCPHCSFESKLPQVFKRHTDSFRICSVCHEIFCGERSARKFESHQKKHIVKPVHECEICNKSFKYPSDLKRHYIKSKCGRQVDY